MSPLALPSNGGNIIDKKQYNVIDKFSKMAINDQHSSNYSATNSSPSTLYQEKGERGRYSATEKDEYNSPKMNSIRVAPTPPSINTYYDPNAPPLPNQRYIQKAMITEDDTFNLESPYETDIPRYYNGSYVNINNYPQQPFNSPPMYDPRLGSPSGNSFAFSPDSAAFYNEMSMPGIDDYVLDYKHQSDYSGKDMYMAQKMGQRQSEYSIGNMTKSSINNSFDINSELEPHHARSFAGESESFSETKSFLQQAAEIDMSFDPSILKGKKPKYMKDLVNSNNFHKGGVLVQSSIFKKKSLFYALTTHRLYAFKEDRSDAELITWYVIDKDARITRNLYSGGLAFELSTVKGNDKNRETHEFEAASKEDRDDWMHSLKKVIQLHKYDEKNLPNLPTEKKTEKELSYTSTLKTPDMKKSNLSNSAMSPDIIPPSFYGNSNTSFSSSYKSPTSPQYNMKYEASISSQGSYSNKVSPMYASPNQNGRRGSPQPVMVPGNRLPKHSSPGMSAIQPQMGSPTYYGGNRTPKSLPINQLIGNQQSIQGRQNQPSPRTNYYQRSPMQRPQGN